MFESVGINRVIVPDVHNVAAFENAFRCPTWHIESAPLFAAHFAPLLRGETVVAVSPDAGGAKRVEQFRQALEQLVRKDIGSAYMEKFRSSGRHVLQQANVNRGNRPHRGATNDG
ncbi:MAG TPA: hypothetical protein VK955_01205 [Xanthobacteraceae bacterium]|nr:hypothetical protein [Xanthobacteraceae bacterium]